jgi:sigma-B regulation protein RsbU (phosphoserine phosphatase)
LNRLLVDLIPRGQFATMFYGIMDTKADALTYSAAAAPSPLISMPNSNNFGKIGEIIVAEARGKPLGISAEAEYTDHHLAFPPGAFLFLYSDAWIEGRDEHGDMLGVDGLSSLLSRRSMAKSDSSPLGDVLDLFNARSRLPLQDDLTAIWLSRSN